MFKHNQIVHAERDFMRDLNWGLNIDQSKKNLRSCVKDFKKRVDQIDLDKIFKDEKGVSHPENSRADMTKSQLENYLFTSKTHLPADAKVLGLQHGIEKILNSLVTSKRRNRSVNFSLLQRQKEKETPSQPAPLA